MVQKYERISSHFEMKVTFKNSETNEVREFTFFFWKPNDTGIYLNYRAWQEWEIEVGTLKNWDMVDKPKHTGRVVHHNHVTGKEWETLDKFQVV